MHALFVKPSSIYFVGSFVYIRTDQELAPDEQIELVPKHCKEVPLVVIKPTFVAIVPSSYQTIAIKVSTGVVYSKLFHGHPMYGTVIQCMAPTRPLPRFQFAVLDNEAQVLPL